MSSFLKLLPLCFSTWTSSLWLDGVWVLLDVLRCGMLCLFNCQMDTASSPTEENGELWVLGGKSQLYGSLRGYDNRGHSWRIDIKSHLLRYELNGRWQIYLFKQPHGILTALKTAAQRCWIFFWTFIHRHGRHPGTTLPETFARISIASLAMLAPKMCNAVAEFHWNPMGCKILPKPGVWNA